MPSVDNCRRISVIFAYKSFFFKLWSTSKLKLETDLLENCFYKVRRISQTLKTWMIRCLTDSTSHAAHKCHLVARVRCHSMVGNQVLELAELTKWLTVYRCDCYLRSRQFNVELSIILLSKLWDKAGERQCCKLTVTGLSWIKLSFPCPFELTHLPFLFPDPLPNAFDGKSHRGGLQGTFCVLNWSVIRKHA